MKIIIFFLCSTIFKQLYEDVSYYQTILQYETNLTYESCISNIISSRNYDTTNKYVSCNLF